MERKYVKTFYKKGGWDTVNAHTKDALLFEELRSEFQPYVKQASLKILKYIPESGNHC